MVSSWSLNTYFSHWELLMIFFHNSHHFCTFTKFIMSREICVNSFTLLSVLFKLIFSSKLLFNIGALLFLVMMAYLFVVFSSQFYERNFTEKLILCNYFSKDFLKFYFWNMWKEEWIMGWMVSSISLWALNFIKITMAQDGSHGKLHYFKIFSKIILTASLKMGKSFLPKL